jgi:hypothetical protein
VETWKYPLVGDEHVTMIERVVIDVPTRKLLKLDLRRNSTAPPCATTSVAGRTAAGTTCNGRLTADAGVRLQFARPQAGLAARGQCGHRQVRTCSTSR